MTVELTPPAPTADASTSTNTLAVFPQVDASLQVLRKHAPSWIEVPLARKIDYARSILKRTAAIAEAQVNAAGEAKGLAAGSPYRGEDWVGGPYIQIRTLRLLIESLETIERRGQLRIPSRKLRSVGDDQVAVEVFPSSLIDRLLYTGFRGEVWMEPGVTTETLAGTIGGAAVHKPDAPKVALVLGAGNVASIGPLDVVHKLFFEGQVVLLKFNPVNEYLGPFVETAFSDLIQDGFLRTAYGGADVGAYLCQHDEIDEIHITGSEQTHDAIVFGPGEDGAERKAANQPVLQKRITSELGNVSPMIVVPGHENDTWSDGDLQFQAENLATQIVQNGGFNCNATKVIVTSASWPQREQLLDRLRKVLAGLPSRPAYYPGAEQRFAQFTELYPEAETLAAKTDGVVPPTLVLGLDADDPRGLLFENESFCSLTGEVTLDTESPEEFLQQAVAFCNDRLRGTLNAGIIIHPSTARQSPDVLDQAIADLRYGSIGLNHWPALSFGLGATTWGAFPGHRLDDIQSGIGTVHNTCLFERPQKSVVYGPFRVFPKPVWFVTHRNAHRVGPKLVRLESRPRLLSVPGVALRAALG